MRNILGKPKINHLVREERRIRNSLYPYYEKGVYKPYNMRAQLIFVFDTILSTCIIGSFYAQAK